MIGLKKVPIRCFDLFAKTVWVLILTLILLKTKVIEASLHKRLYFIEFLNIEHVYDLGILIEIPYDSVFLKTDLDSLNAFTPDIVVIV